MKDDIARCDEQYNESRHTLKNKIKDVKRNTSRKVVEEVDTDPWGKGCQRVIKKMKPASSNKPDERATTRNCQNTSSAAQC